jgi:hypothetical protein
VDFNQMTALERALLAELFRVQCKILDLATSTKSKDYVRKALMRLREEIILVRTQQVSPPRMKAAIATERERDA